MNINDLTPWLPPVNGINQQNNIDPLTGMPLSSNSRESNTQQTFDTKSAHRPDNSVPYPDDPNKRFIMNSRTLDQYALPERYKDPKQISGPILDLAAGKKAKFIVELTELAKSQNLNLITHAVDLAMDPKLIQTNPQIYSNADMHKLPYDDSSIGTVVSSFGPLIFEDYPDKNKQKLLEEIYRVLKPSGEAVITPISSELGDQNKQKRLETLAKQIGFQINYEQVSNCQDPTFIAMKIDPTAMILKK